MLGMERIDKSMEMKVHISRVVQRAAAFYRSKHPGHFLINAHVPAEKMSIPSLLDFNLDEQLTTWLDCKLEAARLCWQAKEGLDDDGIPAICPHFGIAEHSAWLGMDVRLQETTCLPTPLVKTPEDISLLQLSEENKWFRYMKSGYDYLRSRQDGSSVVLGNRHRRRSRVQLWWWMDAIGNHRTPLERCRDALLP